MSSALPPKYPDNNDSVQIRRGKVDSVDLYEVKEHELSLLETGDSNSIYLNFSIFTLSLAFSAVLALATSTFKKPIYEIVCVVITVVGFLIGVLLLILWNRGRKSIVNVVKTIKNRITSQYILLDNNAESPTQP